jgi:hypothetical protein
MWCESRSKARKILQKRVWIAICFYVPAVLGVALWVRHHPATGGVAFGLAAIPALPVIALFVAMGLYLRDESDGFQRDMMIRCMLWGTGALLTTMMFLGFAKMFGWRGDVDQFTEFMVFGVFAAVAKLTYRVQNRVGDDE